ncbi:Fanconi anemia group M protein [Temnothorax longispinosus]|uniref:Fanconi anemia group M protein n=1 Tax=Temnothorax longispinosus TaxID=300112 RepID=A0A4S2KDD8_9HYME|nr:Fanconi anemia group M protein [Temnothorax longispinosus]
MIPDQFTPECHEIHITVLPKTPNLKSLGNTFIVAIVMYNFWRWYSHGKIIFLAPTKPLVAQQIDACYEIMGIPSVDMIELTGFNVYV